jgi:hypothetical protein
MRLAGLAFLLLLTACAAQPPGPAPAPPPPSDPATGAALLELEQAWCVATLLGDSATMARIEDESFVRSDARGNTVSREDELKEVEAHSVEYSVCENREPSVRVGGDAAVVSGVRLLEGVSGDVPFKRVLRFTDTFVHRPDGWKAVKAQCISVEQPG